MIIAVAGNQGSFSHQAGQLYATGQQLADVQFVYAIDSAGVFAAVQTGAAELGIMPLYNPTGGIVQMTLQAMGEHRFKTVASFTMPVQHCLLCLPNVRPDELKTIVSHEQALAQCRQYVDVNWPECQLQPYSDTAQAAADLAAGKFALETAVLAPKMCVELYGLRLIAEGVQDDKSNGTVFIVIGS
ncbi:MAG: hypothetical protein HYV33_03370 [Candidatus Kerfeldbacteria bacterium]|nr:hypothetical protein [Candidatus Kerfeldbacteria bacterium]